MPTLIPNLPRAAFCEIQCETDKEMHRKVVTKFPVSKIRPLQAKLALGASGKPSIEVSFAPFTLTTSEKEGSELLDFNTTLQADFINLPTTELSRLQNKTFDFPANPKDGYIDASFYFSNVHNPVDITKFVFGDFCDGKVPLTMVTKWVMTYENTGFEDFDLTFSVSLSG
ncbi:hypothetical protein AAFO92_07395 [Roseovarius sp. CAU 1744]|uniref:hypothetical protein n=1 Tax=Roseovarius sp. CAU 1744 TaxID=3140368 RepID=UPI00325B2824